MILILHKGTTLHNSSPKPETAYIRKNPDQSQIHRENQIVLDLMSQLTSDVILLVSVGNSFDDDLSTCKTRSINRLASLH